MFLKGETITLRALEPSDAELLYTWENDLSIWPVSYTQTPFSKFILEEFTNAAHQDIYTNRQLRLMINEGAKTIGLVDLFEFDPQHDRCGLGIFIGEEHRGGGKALETIGLVKDYAFNVLHLKQLFVHVDASNSSSLKLFGNSGFVQTGLKKQWHKTGLNQYEDVCFLQCIQDGLTAGR